MRNWHTIVLLFFTFPVSAQNVPPPGIVIPFDQEIEDEKKTRSNLKKTPSKKSAQKVKPDKSEDFLKTAKPRSKQRNITRSQPPKGGVLSSSRGSSQAKRKKAKRKKSRVKSRRIKKVSVQSTGRQTRAHLRVTSSQSPDVAPGGRDKS